MRDRWSAWGLGVTGRVSCGACLASQHVYVSRTERTVLLACKWYHSLSCVNQVYMIVYLFGAQKSPCSRNILQAIRMVCSYFHSSRRVPVKLIVAVGRTSATALCQHVSPAGSATWKAASLNYDAVRRLEGRDHRPATWWVAELAPCPTFGGLEISLLQESGGLD